MQRCKPPLEDSGQPAVFLLAVRTSGASVCSRVTEGSAKLLESIDPVRTDYRPAKRRLRRD